MKPSFQAFSLGLLLSAITLFGCKIEIPTDVGAIDINGLDTLAIEGTLPSSVTAGQCLKLTVVVEDPNQNPAALPTFAKLQLSAFVSADDGSQGMPADDVQFSLNSDCSDPATTLKIPAGQSSADLYFTAGSAEKLIIQISDGFDLTGQFNVTIAAAQAGTPAVTLTTPGATSKPAGSHFMLAAVVTGISDPVFSFSSPNQTAGVPEIVINDFPTGDNPQSAQCAISGVNSTDTGTFTVTVTVTSASNPAEQVTAQIILAYMPPFGPTP